jgi:putative ABC transport system permease protein
VQAAIHDVRYAARTLRRRPLYATLAIATLALGIGAATTIYSVVSGVLLDPLPYRDSSRLVAVYRTFPNWREREGLSARWDRIWFSYPAFRDWQARQTSFTAVGAWASASRTLTGIDAAEQVGVVRASSSLLRVLGVQPTLGRYFLPGEDTPPGAAVAVISHAMWTTRFGAAANVIGTTIRLDGTPYTIVGVLPEGLDLRNTGRPDPVWIPAGSIASDTHAGSTDYLALGRLRDGVTLAQASDETARIVAQSSSPDPVGARLAVWKDEITRGARRPLFLLLGASLVLLMLACVNVATLMLGEASGRATEFATRAALGAGRACVARQLIIESFLVAAGGVLAGAVLARAGLLALVVLAPKNVPRLTGVHVDGRVLIAACLAGAVTALLFGLVPAISLMSASPLNLLGGSAGRATGRHESRVLRSLVAGQIALSCVLLVGAALLGASLRRLSAVDPGFVSERLVIVGLGTTNARAMSGASRTAFYSRVAERIATIPGVDRAAVGSSVPFSGGGSSNAFVIEGRPLPPPGQGIEARRSHVLPGFIETLGVRLLAGRSIDEQDRAGAPPVAVVNETMARRFWPGESAIGKRVGFGRLGSTDDWLTIVGVVSDVKHTSLGDTTRISVYVSAAQQETPYLAILVRSRLDAAALAPLIRASVAAVDAAVPVTRVDDMPRLVSESFAGERFRAVLIGNFATMAGVLAAIGIYGVTTRAIARQRREIGIRMALGSSASRVIGLFVQRAGTAVALGIAIGLLGAFGASRFLAPYLFGTNPSDPVLYSGAAMVLVVVALTAVWLPARRAARTEPASVLRQ